MKTPWEMSFVTCTLMYLVIIFYLSCTFEVKGVFFKHRKPNDKDQSNVDTPVILLQTKVSSPLYLLLPGPAQQLEFQAEPAAESRPVWEFSITFEKLWAVSINSGKSLSRLAAPPGVGLESLCQRYLLSATISPLIWWGKEDWLKVFVEKQQANMHLHNSLLTVLQAAILRDFLSMMSLWSGLSFTEVWAYWLQ